jgi:transposase
VAERCPDSAVQQSIAVDLTLIDAADRLLTALERDRVQTANAHAAQTCDRLRAMPGVGQILARVLRDAIHDIRRVPRVPAFVADCRLVTWAQASAGKRDGTAGTKMGQASRQWAFSEAAGRFWRNHPAGQKYRARLERKHGQGKAVTSLAHTVARAVSDRLKRDTAFDLDQLLRA